MHPGVYPVTNQPVPAANRAQTHLFALALRDVRGCASGRGGRIPPITTVTRGSERRCRHLTGWIKVVTGSADHPGGDTATAFPRRVSPASTTRSGDARPAWRRLPGGRRGQEQQ
ncbi:hypothetical protein GCM10027300_30510 [Modestobacter lapidis]